MKVSTYLACAVLILGGLGLCLYGLFGIDFLFLGSVVLRSFCVMCGVSALWLLFWLIAFRPAEALR